MKWLLDTNVISELRRPRPHPGVVSLLMAQAQDDLYVSAMTMAELRFGIERLPDENHRKALADRFPSPIRSLQPRRFATRSPS